MIALETPIESSLHLVPCDTIQFGAFSERHLHRHTGTRGYDLKDYLQPVGLYDNPLIQYHSSSSQPSFRLLIVDALGRLVKLTGSYTNYTSLSGNTLKDAAGNTLPMRTLWTNIRFSDLGLGEGIYKIYVETGDNNFVDFPANPDGTKNLSGSPWKETRYLQTEWLWVQKNWKDTVLITYRNAINDNGFVWEGALSSLTGQIRVKGKILDNAIQVDTEEYEDGNYRPKTLSAHSYTVDLLNVEITARYMREKLARIVTLSDVAYSSRRMVYEKSIEITEGYPLKGLNIAVRTENPYYEYVSGLSGTIGSFSYPYILAGMRLGPQQSAPVTPLTPAILVSNRSSIGSVVDALNGKLGAYGLNGRFVSKEDLIAYNPDGIEPLKEVNPLVLDSFLELTTGSYSGTATTQAIVNGYYVAIEPDKTDPAFVISPLNGSPGSGTVAVTSNYTPSGTGLIPALYTRIFMGSATTTLNITSPKATAISNGRVGLLTSLTASLSSLNTFNVSALYGALPTLQSIVLTAPNLTTVTGLNVRWAALKTIDFRNAKLSIAQVEQIIIDTAAYVVAGGTNLNNGFLKLESQSPAAPPGSAASSTAINQLHDAGWTVTTD